MWIKEFFKWAKGFFEDTTGTSAASRKAAGTYWLLALLTYNMVKLNGAGAGEAFWGLLTAVLIALGLIASEKWTKQL